MAARTYYATGRIETEHPVRIDSNIIPLSMSWAQGMIGVLPVFNDLEKAKQYAGDKYDILEFQAKPKEDDE